MGRRHGKKPEGLAGSAAFRVILKRYLCSGAKLPCLIGFENVKMQKRWIGRGLAVTALCVITLLTIRTIFQSRAIMYSGEEYIQHANDKLTPCLSSESDVLEQVFIPQSGFLESVSVRLKVCDGGPGQWQMTLRLLDEKRNAVKEKSITQDDLTGDMYCRLEIGEIVRKGKPYRLEIRQTAGSEEEPIACFLIPESPYENRGCTYNGVMLDGNIDSVYAYGQVSRRAIASILTRDAAVLMLLFVRRKRGKNAEEARKTRGKVIVNGVIWVLSPVCLYGLTEVITGHIQSISPEWVIRNLTVSYALFAAFSLLFRQARIGAMVYGALVTALALAVHFVFAFRGSSFTLYDVVNIRTAMSVAGSYTYDMPLTLGLSLQGVVAYMIIQGRFQRGVWRRSLLMATVRVSTICVIATALILVNQASPIQLSFWDIESNYREKGLIYSLYLQCRYLIPDRPEGYSAQAARDIAQRAGEQGAEAERIIPENVIVIMNESFADLESIHPIEANVELLPYFHQLEKNAVKGSLYVPVFGAGTAETEYEVLTGNTKQFLPEGSTAYALYCKEPELGLASYYKQMGYRTVALHPYFARNWNRDQVYVRMGFDEFIAMENWEDELHYLRWCPSDKTAYDKLIRLIESKKDGEKLFMFLVTMQNHGGYGESSALGYEPSVSLDYDEDYPQAELYLSLINESDIAFRDLLNYYEGVDEPTMIVMFGDHLPSVEDAFYERLFGCGLSELTAQQKLMRYQTPFVIWTNYPQESASGLCMSANYLGSVIMERSGMCVPAYNRFLLAAKEEIPVIGMGGVCDAQEQWRAMSELTPECARLLTDYRILQYNRIFDRKENAEIFSAPVR